METFLLSFNIVAPMCLMMLIGTVLRRSGKLTDIGIKEINAVCFYILLPCNLFINIYSAEDLSQVRPQLVLWVLACHVIMLVLLFIIVPRLVRENPKKASIIQACFRANFISFGLVISGALLEPEGQIVVSLLAGIMIPLYNLGGVLILAYYGGERMNWRTFLIKLLKNPFMLATATALLFVVTGIQLPEFILSSVKSLSGAAIPASFLALGGFLNISSIRNNRKEIVLGVLLRLLIMPAILVGLSVLLGYRNTELLAITCTVITPTAVATFNMASMMGADGELAGNLVIFQTLFSLITIMLWIIILVWGGFIIVVGQTP